MKNIAGTETYKLSFDFILVINPHSISSESPNDDMIRMGLKNKPTNNPMAPSNSMSVMNRPNPFRLNRSNSFFILGEIK